MSNRDDSKAISLGHPSYSWRFGQDRRLALIEKYACLQDARILDVGCGIGTYVSKLGRFSDQVHGVDIDPDKVAKAQERLERITVAPAEVLPFPDAFFDVVLLHEVLEHVDDDRQAVEEAFRVTKAEGRLLVFAPNRLYPFETHGAYWRGRYRFGNIPLVGYLPTSLRSRLCPHVRAYTTTSLRQLLDVAACRIIVHTQIFPGFDNVAYRHPRLVRWIRNLAYAIEGTPLRLFGLSHFLVAEKLT